jgi:glycosyltransferase involved in cell wall biosynthesis
MSAVLERGLAHFAAHDGAAAVRRRASTFTWEQTGAEYLALYRSCLPP